MDVCKDCSQYWNCYDMRDYAPPSSCVMHGYRHFSPSIDYLKQRKQEEQNRKKYVYIDGVGKCELVTV